MDHDANDALHPDTLAVHAGRADLEELGVHALPIDLSTTNPLTDIDSGGESYERLAGGGSLAEGASPVYQRLWNPTTARYEEALATLEGADAAVAFSSGMAAITAVIMAAAQEGKRHVVALRPIYGGTDYILAKQLLGTTTTYVTSVDEISAAITDETGIVIAETPANPTLELTSLDELVAAAGSVPLAIDNTFATPVLQQPLSHGAAFSIHSATKYIGGHGDVLGGIVATDDAWATRIRGIRALTGALSHPLASYLSHRGLSTLPLRVRQQQANAQALADALVAMPGVEKRHVPRARRVRRQGSRGHTDVRTGLDDGHRRRLVRARGSRGPVDQALHPRGVARRRRQPGAAPGLAHPPPGRRRGQAERRRAAALDRARER